MKYAIINTNEYNGTKIGVNIFYAVPILSGTYEGEFATSENALNEFPEIFKELEYEIVELEPKDFQIDITPPTPTGYGVVIPEKWEILFFNDKLIVGDFEVPLQKILEQLVIDIVYNDWKPFRDELLKPEYESLNRILTPFWDYVSEQINMENTIEL